MAAEELRPIEPVADTPDQLDLLRGQVDGLDEQIVALVSERTALTLAIGAEKERRGITTMVPGRHTEVIGRYMGAVPEDSPMVPGDAVELGETVMRISRRAQDVQRGAAALAAEQTRSELAGLAEQAVPPTN